MKAQQKKLLQQWLQVLSGMTDGFSRAIVVAGPPGGRQFQPVAAWPAEAATAALTNAALQSIQKGKPVVRRRDQAPAATGQSGDIIAIPLPQVGNLAAVVALEIAGTVEGQLRTAAKSLEWASVWLRFMLEEGASQTDDGLLSVVELVGTCLEQPEFNAAATSAVTDLASRLSCERVSLGFLRRDHARVEVTSRSVSADRRMNLVRAISKSMDEAIEQDATLLYPAPNRDSGHVLRAHEELAKAYNTGAILTIPIADGGEYIGAMTFEHNDPASFDAESIALCETVVSMVGPILHGKYRQDGFGNGGISKWLRKLPARIVGPGHLPLKAGSAITALLLAVLLFGTAEYRITADASLEGSIQRVIVSPIDGYVAEATSRAGDIVAQDDVLARLDNRDLKLEQLKWAGEKSQLEAEFRQAMAQLDSSRVTNLQAQLAKASAQLSLTEEQLARTEIRSPLDGIIVDGDLSQSLGRPVERGDTLFKVAPLDGYRVVLQVDEREIGRLRVGQTGHLALVGMPGSYLPFVLERITPVSTPTEGRNYFTVEAELVQAAESLRPGMQGVGKIEVGRHRLIWIWTHSLTDWARLWAWSWLPGASA